jgi:hypothetical protein
LSAVAAGPGRLWGSQYPFERNHLQRTLVLLGLGSVLGVTVILLVHGDVQRVLGMALIGLGALSALAAASRHRYVRETLDGFTILRTRDGRFVLASAVALAVTAVLVALLVLE